jgi:ATP-dependent Clp protease ATP-binding subunit ClpC
MTSNVGAQQLTKDSSIGFRTGNAAAQSAADYERMKDKVLSELKNTFRPEFLNRIDATIVFRQLTREEIRLIVDLLLVRIKQQLAGQQMELIVTDKAKDAIIEKGYDQAFGARPLRREIQNQIEDPLAEQMLMAAYESGDTVVVDANDDGSLKIEKQAAPRTKAAVASAKS